MRFPVAVIFERTTLANRWVSERWEPVAVVPPVVPTPSAGAPGAPTPVKISDEPSGTRWRFDGHAFELHPTEAEGYYLNLVAPDPKAFVMWRMTETAAIRRCFVIVTVSYNEAARMLDGGERVDAVPLPAGIRTWMEPFVAEHYKPEPKQRVRRNDPLADGSFRRGRR
jgi:hypothetical protein